jgi:poly(A) polymerase
MHGGGLHIIVALGVHGIEARYVGGCVRDALLGHVVSDVDLAANAPPDAVTAALQQAGIKVVPTGLDHGTVTAVIEGRGFEITSLREDIATDGRHAEIRFTQDWQADAARRDFTFNALYAAADGSITDYFAGRDDLALGKVRFIGNAQQRIHEDYLRILRFFRFYAWFGQGEADAAGLKACVELAPHLIRLSFERVWKEIAKTLLALNPVPTWTVMRDGKVLGDILPEATDVTRLAALLALPAPRHPPALVRLAALLPEDDRQATDIARRLKLSRREAEALHLLVLLPAQVRTQSDAKALRRLLYEQGTSLVYDALLLARAGGNECDFSAALQTVTQWESPVLPVQGIDLMQLGIQQGPRIGEILRLLEAWWMAADFRPGRTECLQAAEIFAKG